MEDSKEAKNVVVQLDGLALLKIIKHCKENVPDVCTGQLLGLEMSGRLEVTNCFPTLEETDDSDPPYALEMLRKLRTINSDTTIVGWYQSAFLGSFFTNAVVKAQYDYQVKIPNSVVIVYDPFRTTGGKLALKVYRLTNKFMKLFKKNDFSHEAFTKLQCNSQEIFEEVPLKVHNSHLVHGFLYELRESKQLSSHYDRLRTSPYAFLQKNLDMLSTSIEDYAAEQGKYQYLQRQLARAQAAKLAAENEKRIKQGQEPRVDDSLVAPSRLETFLISNQISLNCEQIISSSFRGLSKLYVVDALQEPSEEKAQQPLEDKEKEKDKAKPQEQEVKAKETPKTKEKEAPKTKGKEAPKTKEKEAPKTKEKEKEKEKVVSSKKAKEEPKTKETGKKETNGKGKKKP